MLLAERFSVVDVPKCSAPSGIVSIGYSVLAQQVRKQALVVAFQPFGGAAFDASAITRANGICPAAVLSHSTD